MILRRVFSLKKRIINNMIGIIIITLIGCFAGCYTKPSNNNTTTSESIEEIKKSQHVAFTEIAYASKERVIFYGNVGLIVYDLVNEKIYRVVNLKSINMNHIQGDTVTIFSVKDDGSQILMYNDSDDKNIFLYDIEKDTLEKTNNKGFTNE